MNVFGGQLAIVTPSSNAAEAKREANHDLSSRAQAPPSRTNSVAGSASGGEVDRFLSVTHKADVDLAVISEIREQWRRRQNWHRAEKSLTLQAKALCRRLTRGDKKEAELLFKAALGKGELHHLADVAFGAIFPLIEARKGLEKHRKAVEKRLEKLAASLPVAPWVDSVRGFGLLSLAGIVGEAGDLSAYANPAKLWKRMGVAVMPDGGRQRRIAGDEAIEHGYSPSRRSLVWAIGDCLIKQGDAYRSIYDVRKVLEAERVETKGHAHNRAKRYMEKRLLLDLWRAWRQYGNQES